MIRKIFFQGAGLLLIAFFLGTLRPNFPQGISWFGKWPTSSTSAEAAYKMVAKPGDPSFISLSDAIKMHEDKTGIFLDARTQELFGQGHIPGARNLPFYEIETFQEKALEGASEDTPLIIYCEGIGCELSFFLGRELTASGYKQIHIFYGGYPEWADTGLAVEY